MGGDASLELGAHTLAEVANGFDRRYCSRLTVPPFQILGRNVRGFGLFYYSESEWPMRRWLFGEVVDNC